MAESLGAVRALRRPEIVETVVFVDGLPGCGKTLLAPIVGSLSHVELMQPSYIVEFVCELHTLERIPDDAAMVLVRMVTDLQLYNGMMARETNFRFSDISSAWSSPRRWQYLMRLMGPGDAGAMERVRRERAILNLFTHYLLGKGRIVFDAFGSRVRFVEVVRHPLYMIRQQFKYMHRWGQDPRDFAVCFSHEGHVLPWWAFGWEDRYLRAGLMDRVILMIDAYQRLVARTLAAISPAQRSQILTIPFERFVVDPWPYLQTLETLLDTHATRATRRVLRRQNVPRKMYADGVGRKIYREYGWQPPRHLNEAEELADRRRFATAHASAEAMDVLDALCADYQARYFSDETFGASESSECPPRTGSSRARRS